MRKFMSSVVLFLVLVATACSNTVTGPTDQKVSFVEVEEEGEWRCAYNMAVRECVSLKYHASSVGAQGTTYSYVVYYECTQLEANATKNITWVLANCSESTTRNMFVPHT